MRPPRLPRPDAGASAVMGTVLILCVAVLLGAAAHQWSMGFDAARAEPPRNVGLASDAPIDPTTYAGDYLKRYVVGSAVLGLRYGDLAVVLDDAPLAFDTHGCAPAAAGRWGACAGAASRGAGDPVRAGDALVLRTDDAPMDATLRVLDARANAVVATLVVR